MLLPLRLLLPDFSYQGLSSKVDFYRNQNLFFFLHQELVPNLADDHFLPMVCSLAGGAVQGVTPTWFLAGWTVFWRNPVPTEYCLGYNLPWWAPSSSCSSASATALDMAVAILMWCSSGWCSIPCSCIGSYLSSVVVDPCYLSVCRLLFMFSCYHRSSFDALVYMLMPWSYSYAVEFARLISGVRGRAMMINRGWNKCAFEQSWHLCGSGWILPLVSRILFDHVILVAVLGWSFLSSDNQGSSTV